MTALDVHVNDGAQSQFFESTTTYAALVGGRGCAKSAALVLKTFRLCLDHPGIRGVLTAPTAPMAKNILYEAARDLFGAGLNVWWSWKEKEAKIVFANGSIVWLRPSEEVDTFRGWNIAFCGMDEAGIGNQWDAFRLIGPSLRQPGYPNFLWVATTPKAESPWIKQLWQDGVHPDTGEPLANPGDYEMFHATMYDNPHLTDEYKARMLALYPPGTRLYEQEIMGRFISIEGVAFPDFGEIHNMRMPEGINVIRTATGLDFGMTSPTSLHIGHLDAQNRVWITDEFYMRNASEWDWTNWLADRLVKRVICDPAAGEKEMQRLRRRYGINIVASNAKERPARYNLWAARLSVRPETGKPLLFIDKGKCPNLWDEMLNLRYARPRGHEFAQDKWASGVQDHAYDSVSYLLSDLDSRPRGRPKPNIELVHAY